MTDLNEKTVMEALDGVVDPAKQAGLASAGMISGLQIKDGHVMFSIEVDPQRGPEMEPLRQQAEKAVAALSGVDRVTAILTAEKGKTVSGKLRPETPLAPTIKNIVAVASGKGGVGKSTVSANLAVALVQKGFKTGLLDADIYGPSVPRLMNLSGQKPDSTEDGKIVPLEAYGVKVMSIGFMVAEETPMIWRGPMVQTALQQLLRDVDWGDIDVLIVDMPPGTGDAQLTMAQKVPMAGSVIVSTPQDLALLDARKGLNMFRKVGVPVFGMIENMSTFVCPECGHEAHIFGHGTLAQEAEKLGCDYLGAIPLHPQIRELSDAGTPVVVADPEGPQAQAFLDVAGAVADQLNTQSKLQEKTA